MGTWGAGNFDSDAALDMLGAFTDRIADEIDEILEKDQAGADDRGESELMPKVAILYALCKHCAGSPPEPDRVIAWRDAYLPIYDQTMSELGPKEGFLDERRAVIVETFSALEAEAVRFWSP